MNRELGRTTSIAGHPVIRAVMQIVAALAGTICILAAVAVVGLIVGGVVLAAGSVPHLDTALTLGLSTAIAVFIAWKIYG
jgi:hypothetical protein